MIIQFKVISNRLLPVYKKSKYELKPIFFFVEISFLSKKDRQIDERSTYTNRKYNSQTEMSREKVIWSGKNIPR